MTTSNAKRRESVIPPVKAGDDDRSWLSADRPSGRVRDAGTPIVGILGGMGPVASAEFLKTIYEGDIGSVEQMAPAVILYSDPSFPDRTEAFLSGRDDAVLERLVTALSELHAAGASAVVLCCVTVHHLLPRLSDQVRARIVSLLDIVTTQLEQARGSYLVLCSRGSRELRLFENHAKWGAVADRAVFPNRDDQETIHTEIICAVKRNADLEDVARRLDGLLEKYDVDGFIAGCTEIHVLAKHYLAREHRRPVRCIDPLVTVAQRIRARQLLLPAAVVAS